MRRQRMIGAIAMAGAVALVAGCSSTLTQPGSDDVAGQLDSGGAEHVEVVATGFELPLGLAIGQDGTVYVAEAFDEVTLSGRLTTFRLGAPEDRTVLATEPGFLAGVDAQGRGNVFYTAVGDDATLTRVRPNGNRAVIASLADYEATFNPDQDQIYGFLPGDIDEACRAELPPFLQEPYSGIVDSNPYAVAIDGGSVLVADAAGNTIIRVAASGRLSTVAVLPPIPQAVTADVVAELGLPECAIGATYTGEFVPTDVEVGPDGHYYVSSLPGAPELPGHASVWRIDSSTGEASMIADGLSFAVDLAVAADGTIYVAELFADRISMISGGVVSSVVEVPLPGAIEIAPDGTIYATIGVFFPGGASVVRITP